MLVLEKIQAEQVVKTLDENLKKIHQKESIFNLIKENGKIYWIKISFDFPNKIEAILKSNNFIIDTPLVAAGNNLVFFARPLWVIKVRYSICFQDKKEKVIKRFLFLPIKVLTASKKAVRKTLAEFSHNFNHLEKYFLDLKGEIRKYLKDPVKTGFRKVEKRLSYYADDLKYFINKIMKTILLLENNYILNKDFSASLIFYLRPKRITTGVCSEQD